MLLLDEYDALNKKHIELTKMHETLKSTHVEPEEAFHRLDKICIRSRSQRAFVKNRSSWIDISKQHFSRKNQRTRKRNCITHISPT
ncbi:hypothetical protein MA16_Dca023512 [Dendrobium catenatum]|uniref:Uncharacterized protein n=1 Tax=Dendrobium catenatum TaxID=906689 RepID=A0A2I0XHC6_9ASPA|nr:hypothetical protein MA16_Dca023512 [Dendrobium catenatum]